VIVHSLTGQFGPEATQNLSDMREGCRYLAAMAEKIGEFPDAAPPPRTKP